MLICPQLLSNPRVNKVDLWLDLSIVPDLWFIKVSILCIMLPRLRCRGRESGQFTCLFMFACERENFSVDLSVMYSTESFN